MTPLSYNTGGSSGDDPAGSLVGFGVEASTSRAKAGGFVCGETRFWKFALMVSAVDGEVRGGGSERAETAPLVAVPAEGVEKVATVEISEPSGMQNSGQRRGCGVECARWIADGVSIEAGGQTWKWKG